MKLKSTLTSVALIVGAVFFVTPAPAIAGECSAADPCQTYAMVDGSGNVTNIIVCQPSVCGSGTFAGSRVVPQVAANAQGQNQGGYLSNPGTTPVKESNGVFTITNDGPTVQANVVKNENTTTVTSTSLEPGVKTSFTFNDTVGAPGGRPTMTVVPMDESIGATLSVVEVTNSETPTVVSEEKAVFEKRETEQFVELTLQVNKLNKLLSNWRWFKQSLMAWFL